MIASFFSKNYLIFTLLIVIGAIIAAPPIYFRYFDDGYKGIDLFGADSEHGYLAQIREIYDGHFSFGNVYLIDEKDQPYVQQPMLPMLTAFLGKISGLSVLDINLAAKFLFPVLLGALLYVFFLTVFRRKDVALLSAAFILLTPVTTMFFDPKSWFHFFSKGEFIGTELQFLSYARPINPQLSSFFFFGYLLFIWKFLFDANSDKLKKIFGFASAIILGLSFYSYFFTFSFLFAVNGVLAIWFLYKRNWAQLKKIIYVSSGAVIIGIPYFINAIKVFQSPFYGALSQRLGAIDSRQFIFSRVWWGVFIAFILLYRKLDQLKIFILALLAAAFLVTNQQIITGRTVPVLSHYHWYYIAPLGGVILIYLFFVYCEKKAGVLASRIIAATMILFFLCAGIMFQRSSYLAQRDSYMSWQRYAASLHWLEKNVSEESVVFGNKSFSEFLPVYTHHDIYYYGNAGDFLINGERLRNSYYVSLFLDHAPDKEGIKEFLYNEKNRAEFGNRVFGIYYREKNGCYECFPDSELDKAIGEYKNFLDKDFIAELKKYRLDYFVWDKKNDPDWRVERFFKNKIYDEENISIYKVS